MSNLRMATAQRHEKYVLEQLGDLGLSVQQYSQAMLTAEARQMLRGVKTAERWKQDYIVRAGRRTVLVDAKCAWHNSSNHSVEMRSLLVARRASDLPTFYVCSHVDVGGTFVNTIALHQLEVITDGPEAWPCCSRCAEIFNHDPDPMHNLPDYCPGQDRNRRSSGTPYFVIKPPFRALYGGSFDSDPILSHGRYWISEPEPPAQARIDGCSTDCWNGVEPDALLHGGLPVRCRLCPRSPTYWNPLAA